MAIVKAAPSLRLGVDTSDPNASQFPGEAFDKKLMYEPCYQRPLQSGRLLTEVISQTQGLWWLIDITPAGRNRMQTPRQTLAQWLADPVYGTRLSAGQIVAVQFSLGNFNAGTTGIVTHAEGSMRIGGQQRTFSIDFRDLAGAQAAGWSVGDAWSSGSIDFPGAGAPRRGLRIATATDTDVATLERKGNFGLLSAFAASYTWIVE